MEGTRRRDRRGDLDDESALTRALQGTKGAYVLLPPIATTTDFLGSRARMIEAIGTRRGQRPLAPPGVSVVDCAHLRRALARSARSYRAERRLRNAGDRHDVRAAVVLPRELRRRPPAAKNDGVLPSFMPANFIHAVVTTTDVGRTAAQALLDGPRGRRVIELSGPVDVTPADVAAALSELLGRTGERRRSAARCGGADLHVVRDVAADGRALPRDVRELHRRPHQLGRQRANGFAVRLA